MLSGIGIGLPQAVRPAGDGAELRRFVTAAEAAGFESAWVVETTRPGMIDPLAALTFAAACTSRIRLGTAILLSALRSPARLAHEVASLDRLSDGRVILGVGLGNGREPGRANRFEAGVGELRSLLSTPIWIGARARPALDRAVRLADGWVGAGSSTVSAFTGALAIVRERLAAHGRDPATFSIAKRVYIHVGAPIPAVRQWYESTYGPVDDIADLVVMGEPGECAERIAELRHLGVQTLILHPVLDPYEQMLRLASDVVPVLG